MKDMYASQNVGVGAWDPHHSHLVTTCDGGTIRNWDLRMKRLEAEVNLVIFTWILIVCSVTVWTVKRRQ